MRKKSTLKQSFSLSAALAAFVLAGASGTAAAGDGCFLFVNETRSMYHISFDTQPMSCPTGTCWQADVPPGTAREYCPGELVYPPPSPFGYEFRLVFKRDGYFWSEMYGHLNREKRSFRCRITVPQDGGGVRLDRQGCDGTGL